jgi:DNA-nicking Smr family endonuclease
MSQLDLHGMKHKEAMEVVEDFVFTQSQTFGYVFSIITGNSTTLQNKVLTFLQAHNFKYYIPADNLGMIIISE